MKTLFTLLWLGWRARHRAGPSSSPPGQWPTLPGQGRLPNCQGEAGSRLETVRTEAGVDAGGLGDSDGSVLTESEFQNMDPGCLVYQLTHLPLPFLSPRLKLPRPPPLAVFPSQVLQAALSLTFLPPWSLF